MKTLRIATRNSPLAIAQTNEIAAALKQQHSDLTIEIVGMTTEGDRKLDSPLYESGGKGLFIKELEKSLLAKETDIAVHSMKDLPAELPGGLILSTICQRADPRDVFVSNQFANLDALPAGARVGTSSPRRQSQLYALRPDLEIISLRGNVNTRLKKLDNEEFDAIILAAAGLMRLNLDQRITQAFSPEQFIPAIGQGVIGIECRQADHETQQLVAVLNHQQTQHGILAERAITQRLGAGCHLPVGGHATVSGSQIALHAFVGSLDGSQLISASESGSVDAPEELGNLVAERLLAQGAQQLLDLL